MARDVTFWGVFALAVWAVAILGGNISAMIPDSVLGGLHASRLEGANLIQLRSQMAALQSQAAELKLQNSVLLQRMMLTEQNGGDVTKRVGALELTLPRLLEAANTNDAVDRGAVTASTSKAPVTSFNADGGSVSFTTTPLPGAPNAPQAIQPMPQALDSEPTPDPNAFGIALGPPIDEDEAEGAWQAMNSHVGTLLIGLGPVLGRVEGGAGRRLVAGPIASEADARALCGQMAKVGIACASVPFIGDPLPMLN